MPASAYGPEFEILEVLPVGISPSDEVLRAVRWAHQGRTYLSPDSSTHIVAEYLQGRKARMATDRYEELTPREQEVFRLLVDGYTNKAIARALYISPKTVDTHRASIMRKLEVNTFPELVRYAVSIGLLEVEPEESVL